MKKPEKSQRNFQNLGITERLARCELVLFAIAASSGMWLHYRHAKFLALKVQECVEKQSGRLIIEIPPRHGKTELCSIYAPVWYLKNNPKKHVIYCTYGGDLAYSKSRRARQLFRELPYGVKLSEESQSVQTWNLENLLGGYTATGVGGPITGKGADLLVFDDPYKNQEEANSETYRRKVVEYWQFTLATRLMPGASAILIQTRWHHADLAGTLKATGDWDVVTMRAIAEDDDPLGRIPGQALCPQMYDEKAFERIRKEVGSFAWSALYQQRPTPRSGGYFKSEHFRYYTETEDSVVLVHPDGKEERIPKRILKCYQTVDSAGTAKMYSDYFVCLTFYVTPNNDILIRNVFREKAETTRHDAILEQQERRYNPIYQAVEKKTFGINIIQQAAKKGRPVKELIADTSKEIRAEQAVIFYENGKVYHYREGEWLSDFETEILSFPAGEHDDQVDCLSYAALLVREDECSGNMDYMDYV